MRILRPIFALGVSALVAGCGSGTRGVTPSVAVNVPDTGTSGTLTFTITVPKKVNPKAKSYVSPASKGLWMNFTLGSHTTVQTFTLSKSSPGCTAKPGSLVCTISVSLAAGTYVSSIMVYDKPPFNGKFGKTAHVLSEEQNLKYRINGGKTTTIHPVLKGNDTSLKILNFPQGCVSGSFGPTAFTVAALDYDGYTIAGTYEASIALSDGDTSGNTTLAVSGPDNPPPDTLLSSLDTSTISWNGGALTNGGATITAAIRGFSTSATLWAGPADVLFYYTGSPAYLTVSPCAASSVTVWLWGAAGGSTYDQSVGAQGGYGGLVVATIPATTGQQLMAVVGGVGNNGGSSAGLGGYNGGASGQLPPPSCKQSEFYCISGGGGGGGTDIRQGGSGLSNRVVVAGGGGGAGELSGANGGGGGGSTGNPGGPNGSVQCGYPDVTRARPTFFQGPAVPGGGGTQTSGGKGGADAHSFNNDGTFGAGGVGYGFCVYTQYGEMGAGGGGGGWYGGGGAYHAAGGGGGSGYTEPSATNTFMETGFNSGAGIAEICWPQNNCKVTLEKSRRGKIAKPTRR